jgi:hypothetical protein
MTAPSAHTATPQLHIGQATNVGGLSIFPVWTDAPETPDLTTGGADLSVAEREGSPVVGELVLTNPSPKPVLLLAGELFEGGWQHRALNHDVVLAPASRHVASVSCVEAGRWHGTAGQARRARRASVLVRSAQAMSTHHERQGRVWERVSRYDATFGASATSSFVDHLDRAHRPGAPKGARTIASDLGSIRPLAGQRGVVVGLGGQPAFLELFPTTTALEQHLPAPLSAVAVDAALVPSVPTPGRRARRLVERMTMLRLSPDVTRDAGAGRLVTGGTAYHSLEGILWRGHLAHATIFNPRHPLLAA